jgi:hypothetical protein
MLHLQPVPLCAASRNIPVVYMLDSHSRPLHPNPAADDNDNGTLSADALSSRARMQAFLPTASGGLGLCCAQLAREAAYVAAWADYLRLIGTVERARPET